MTESLMVSEMESAAVATAPRVSLESMEAKIAKIDYLYHKHLTICIIEMQNGFFVVGESAPASVANFNAQLGRKFAYENAVRQLWKLEGYALRETLSKGAI